MKKILGTLFLCYTTLAVAAPPAEFDLDTESLNIMGLREGIKITYADKKSYSRLTPSLLLDKRAVPLGMRRNNTIINGFGDQIDLIPAQLEGGTKNNGFSIIYPEVSPTVCFDLVVTLLSEFPIIEVGNVTVKGFKTISGTKIKKLCEEPAPITFTSR